MSIKIEHCPLTYQCDQQWKDFLPKGDDSFRYCLKCQSLVYWCKNETELSSHLKEGHCVAFNFERAHYVGKQESTYRTKCNKLNWD